MIAAILFLILLAGAACFVVYRSKKLIQHGNAVRLTCEMYYPLVIVSIYGFAATPLFFHEPSHFPGYVGVNFKKVDILFAFFVMMFGSLSYVAGFNLTYRAEARNFGPTRAKSSLRDSAFNFGAVILAIIDVIVRIQQIKSGQYFDWMRGRAADLFGDGQSALWLLQGGLAPILAAIATHKSRESRGWLLYLFALLFMLVLEGKRTNVGLALVAALVVHFVLNKNRIRLSRLFVYVAIGIFVMSFVSAAILEARIQYRSNIVEALSDPTRFVAGVAFDVIPRAAVGVFTGAEIDTTSIRGVSFSERMPSWVISFVSEIVRVGEVGLLPIWNAVDEMTVVVPSFFWFGEKPFVGIGTVVANYYNLWEPGSRATSADLASTAMVTPYLYFGLPGVVIYSTVLGALIGWMASFVRARLGLNGVLIMIGSIGFLRPLSNSMAGPVVGFRNLLIVIFFMVFLDLLFRTFLRSSALHK